MPLIKPSAQHIRAQAAEAYAMMASSNRAGTREPCTRLADDVDSAAGRLAVAAFQAISARLPLRIRWAAAEALLRSRSWRPAS